MAITALVPADRSVAAKAAQFHALIERRECSQLFIICCGQAGALMMDPIRFIREAQIIDRNVLIIRDPDQNCYQRGVSAELSDIPRLLDWLRARIAALPHVRSVYCLGSSGGAYMAMIAGHFLEAQAVWAFAPPAVVTVQGRVHSVDPRFCDLARVLADGNGVTRYRVYFNERHDPDRDACSRLEDLPGVQLFPQGGEGHGVIVHLAETNRLATLFPPVQRL